MIKLLLWDLINARRSPEREIPESLAERKPAMRLPMDENFRLAIYNLLWVWSQYGKVSQYREGEGFEHQNSAAGEDAADLLEALGLGFDQGHGFIPNEVARALMDCETSPATKDSLPRLINYGGSGRWDQAILGPIPLKE